MLGILGFFGFLRAFDLAFNGTFWYTKEIH